MLEAVEHIAAGRLGIETDGREHDGMVEFSEGVNIKVRGGGGVKEAIAETSKNMSGTDNNS
jgi:hypothetical protein